MPETTYSDDDIESALLEMVSEGLLEMSVDSSGQPVWWFADTQTVNRSREAVAHPEFYA